VSHFEEFAKFARSASFQVYVVDIISDAQTCFARNTHNRTLKDIQNVSSTVWPGLTYLAQLPDLVHLI